MATIRGSRLPVGSAPWISEERAAALQIAEDEVEEFSYSVRNDFEWLNEHMAGIFDENEVNVAEMFKTPGKLRGKTPRTARKQNTTETRVPLSDIFSGTPRGVPNPFLQQLNRLNSPSSTASNELKKPTTTPAYSPPKRPLPSPNRQIPAIPHADSGYHGSQSQDIEGPTSPSQARTPLHTKSPAKVASPVASPTLHRHQSPTRTRILQSPTATFLTAKEEQTARIIPDASQRLQSPQITRTARNPATPSDAPSSPVVPRSQFSKKSPVKSSPVKTSPVKISPTKTQVASPIPRKPVPTQVEPEQEEADDLQDDEGSHSESSSPIRPAIRKSSLNFATLPAREPLTTGKSLGGRISRTSHLDLNRTSYYGRPTGGKSLSNTLIHPSADNDDDEMNIDDDEKTISQKPTEPATDHNKTYTQRLQDRIGMLGQSQAKPSRPSKSIANLASINTATTPAPPSRQEQKASSPRRKPTTPGAFPDDDDDDWIDPPMTAAKQSSPPPAVPPKDYAANTTSGMVGTDGGNSDFVLPKQRQPTSRPTSPYKAPIIPERTTSTMPHMKSASVSALPSATMQDDVSQASPKKGISVSNPTLATVSESDRPQTPMKSPSRTLRDSPLKQVKNKLSSILKSSKGLLASSAAISAEGKSSILSPSTTRLGYFPGPSSESVAQPNLADSMYPDLTKALSDAQAISSTASPPKANGRRTRASAERERKEKMIEKEARRLADQMEKLEKEREKEREKARVFSKEQERIAAMEKQVTAQKEQEKKRPVEKEPPKPTRSSPRRAKPQAQDQDVEMQDASAAMPPPPQPASIPRPAGPGPAIRNRELKRPTRPGKDTATKSKAAPTVIKVNMGPHHSQYHPSNNTLSANLHESLATTTPQTQLSTKPSQSKLKSKSSVQSLKSSVSSTGRPKALELAAKRKEQEEREAQRKRDARAEMERKRAAQQEEDRRIEAEKQKAKERELEAKKAAQRQAAIEKAKQTRAPPPAVRSQPNGPPDYAAIQEQQAGSQPSRPPSRLGSSVFRPQEDLNRPVNALLSNANKAQKRPLGQDNDAGNARAQPTRNGPTYQGKDAKRRRTSQEPDEDKDIESLPNIKGPPVRPSAGYKKVRKNNMTRDSLFALLTMSLQPEAQTKPVFNNGYSAVPTGASRDLFKTTVTSQHNSAMKAAHALDTAQFSKGAIPFAPNPSQAGTAYKTPGRQGQVATIKSTAKSAPRTSPRFQNGDSIELPEIDTDDDDEDSDADQGMVASWADSPDLRRALLRQETMDPSQIFGPPAPLNMEEVFSKSKDRWHKFRARTSSANWSGADRLTEDDIRKDLAARDRLRREGAWTYELSKDMA
ncbi:hypothetical protein jhhlp_003694 [Lomentospora prolificans]|uniref:Inner centromere protein ARK-binding domain-containing protein n=1 Tax=Lomentospora prolificans TaxID=41688 RepID=A0A2N3N9G8_9PEZI|nr:hypothetical protein jhhlp_003694 [Lomentospora prolificans]